jgi:RNA-directed DNA polymerase
MMESVVARENLLDAYQQVMGNKAAAGVDNMTVEQLKPYLHEHWARIRESLLNGTYQPPAVRYVEIPIPNGGVRQLGIPTVVDRLIQPACIR